MIYGLKKTKFINGQNKILIMCRDNQFLHRQFVGGGGRIPKTYKTLAGARRAAERMSGVIEVFPINDGVMEPEKTA